MSVTPIQPTKGPEGPKIASIPTLNLEESALKDGTTAGGFKKVSRSELIELLNQDLSREYQAIIGYVVYSQVLKGAEFMNIAGELEKHAAQELSHALIIAKQIDYLGGCRRLKPRPSRHQKKPRRCCSSISTRNGNDSKLSRASPPMRGVGRVCHGRTDSRDFDRRARPPNCSGDGFGQERANSA